MRFSTDNDSIGEVLCKRAQALKACAVVMASHNKVRCVMAVPVGPWTLAST